jgi:bis(5'-nucleosidyl)-tetraphosphatase
MADVKAAGAICYLQDGKKTFFLLLRSAKTGEWGPPKGHSEENESELETAVRELYEEAGIRRVSFTPGFREVLNYTVEKKGKMREKEVVFFLCKLDSDEVRISDEHTEAHFGTLDEIEVLVPHEDLRAVYRKALEFVSKP